MHGMTQKYLGTAVGFPERSVDVRLVQYEMGTRKPKSELTSSLAQAFDVPDIDSYIGLMHILFIFENIYGLTVSETAGEVCLKVDRIIPKRLTSCCKCSMLEDKLSSGEPSKEEYAR